MVQDFFMEEVVHRYQSTAAKTSRIILIVLTVIMGFLFLFINSIVFSLPFVVLIIGCVFMQRDTNLEFDYELTNTELVFSRVKNKEKRKDLLTCDIQKDLLMVAPSNSGMLYQYEKSSKKTYDCSSHKEGDSCYTMVVRTKNAPNGVKVLFNPSEEMLGAMERICRDRIHK